MNVLLQRHCARYIYVVPEGLKELMSDISREVIRCDPENIYTFIADYLDALLITRENARVAARLVQSITDIATTTVEFLLNTGMNRPEADNVVNILEKTFRQCIQTSYAGTEGTEPDEVEEINIISDIINEADIPPEIGEQAATIIQNAYRKFKIRRDKERELLSGMVDWRVAARSAIRLYRKTGVTYEEANRAATLIKAAYKGYYTRRVMRKLAEESKLLADAIDEEEIEEEEISEHDQKIVKIDYGTIIPHVDFDEPKVAEVGSTDTSVSTPEAESTTSTVVYSVAEEILNLTLQEIKKRELHLKIVEEGEETLQGEEEKISEEKKASVKDGEEETEAEQSEELPQPQIKSEELATDNEGTEGKKKEIETTEGDQSTEHPAVSEAKQSKKTLHKKSKGMGLRMQYHSGEYSQGDSRKLLFVDRLSATTDKKK